MGARKRRGRGGVKRERKESEERVIGGAR